MHELDWGFENNSVRRELCSARDGGTAVMPLLLLTESSNVTQLDDIYVNSETLLSFESCCSGYSEQRILPKSLESMHSTLEERTTVPQEDTTCVGDMSTGTDHFQDSDYYCLPRVPPRRASCPSIIVTVPMLIEAIIEVPPRRPRAFSVHTTEVLTIDDCQTARVELERDRVRQSLIRLTESGKSSGTSHPGDSCIGQKPPITSRTSFAQIPAPGDICNISIHSLCDFNEEAILNTSQDGIDDTASSISSIHAPSQRTALGEHNATIAKMTRTEGVRSQPQTAVVQRSGTLRINSEERTRPDNSGRGTSAFMPSEAGKLLVSIFTTTKNQKVLWDTFCDKALRSMTNSGNPMEYADIQNRMPSVVFTLRGLIRFGDGEYGSSRMDAIPFLIQILIGKHAICETSSHLEAVEYSASLLSMLAVHPVSRSVGKFSEIRARPAFEQVLLGKSCMILQQIVSVLSTQLNVWISLEMVKNPSLSTTSRAVASLMEILFLYCSTPKLRSAWILNSPPQFQESIPQLVISISNRLASLSSKCMDILDIALDHMPRMSSETIYNTASILRICSTHNPDIRHRVCKWQPQRSSARTFAGFFKLFKSSNKQSKSIKSMIFNEFNRHS